MSMLAKVSDWLKQHGLRESDCTSINFDRACTKGRDITATLHLDLPAFSVAFAGMSVEIDESGSHVWYERIEGDMKFRAIGEPVLRRATRIGVIGERAQVAAAGAMNVE